jgi:hypothetical protein
MCCEKGERAGRRMNERVRQFFLRALKGRIAFGLRVNQNKPAPLSIAQGKLRPHTVPNRPMRMASGHQSRRRRAR